jgi:hypothetical protein
MPALVLRTGNAVFGALFLQDVCLLPLILFQMLFYNSGKNSIHTENNLLTFRPLVRWKWSVQVNTFTHQFPSGARIEIHPSTVLHTIIAQNRDNLN